MKTTLLTVLMTLASAGTALAGEFDQHLKACHDAVWARDEFKDIPNAGVSAFPGGFDDDTFYAYWIVDWETVQVAGKCVMQRNTAAIIGITAFRK